MTSIAKPMKTVLRSFVDKQRRPLSAFGFFVIMIVVFSIANPQALSNVALWMSVFVSLPMAMILTVALVFVIAAGEIDLSFGSVVGLTGWAFAAVIQAGGGPVLGGVAAGLTGAAVGLLNGWLVTRVKLSSLVATLGMNFLVRGLINIGMQGFGIPLHTLRGTFFYNLFVGKVFSFPVQMFWGIAFAGLGWILFNRHRFGDHICCVGDNADSAREMGINVARVKTQAFVFVGLAAAFVGVISALVNLTLYPTAGEGYLLAVLAAVFVGGTPTWGGVGTIIGAVIGAMTVSWIETGIIVAGLTAFYTRFFYGLVIILSIVGHRFNQSRFRYD